MLKNNVLRKIFGPKTDALSRKQKILNNGNFVLHNLPYAWVRERMNKDGAGSSQLLPLCCTYKAYLPSTNINNKLGIQSKTKDSYNESDNW
jgi:hypothetical protein